MKQRVTHFLNNHEVGVLASGTTDGAIQAATIFYIVDCSGGLIFKSRSASEHMVSLKVNGVAAIAVYDHSSNYKNKTGVQLKGLVDPITDKAKMERYVEQYGNSFEGALARFAPIDDLVLPLASSTLYRFQIHKFKFTDTTNGIEDVEYHTW